MGAVLFTQRILNCMDDCGSSIDDLDIVDESVPVVINSKFVCRPDPDHVFLFSSANKVFNEYMHKSNSKKYVHQSNPKEYMYNTIHMNGRAITPSKDTSRELYYLIYKIVTVVLQKNGATLLDYVPDTYNKKNIYIDPNVCRVDFHEYHSQSKEDIPWQKDDENNLLLIGTQLCKVYTVIMCLNKTDYGGDFEIKIDDDVQTIHMSSNMIIHIPGGIYYRIIPIFKDDEVSRMILFRYKRSPSTDENTSIVNIHMSHQIVSNYLAKSVTDVICTPQPGHESLMVLAKKVFRDHMLQDDSKTHMYSNTLFIGRRMIVFGKGNVSSDLQLLINQVINNAFKKNGIIVYNYPIQVEEKLSVWSDIYRIDFHHYHPNMEEQYRAFPWHIDDKNNVLIINGKNCKLYTVILYLDKTTDGGDFEVEINNKIYLIRVVPGMMIRILGTIPHSVTPVTGKKGTVRNSIVFNFGRRLV